MSKIFEIISYIIIYILYYNYTTYYYYIVYIFYAKCILKSKIFLIISNILYFILLSIKK